MNQITPISVIPGAFNLRELGGYVVEGGVIRPGLLYRSDLLNRVDESIAYRWLDQSAVTTLVDLRTAPERDLDGFIDSIGSLRSEHRSLLSEVWSWKDEQDSGSEWFLRDKTVGMFEEHPDRIVEVLEDLAAREGAALFHCTAGKDRTGVISSALLGVLGASDDVIIADYARSTDAMAGIVAWYREQAIAEARAEGRHIPESTGETEAEIIRRAAAPETMRGVLDILAERHGDFAGWARDIGIDPALIARLRTKYVA